MNNSKLREIFKSGNIVVPVYFFKNYKKFNLQIEEFMFLMYLYSLGNNYVFDPSRFSTDLNMDNSVVMENINKLTEKGYINVDVVKNDKGLMEEVVSLDGFYDKITLFSMEDNDNKNDSDIYEIIEKEFGRMLGSIESEIVTAWLDSNYSEDLIKEALKEATRNGVFNLKYIDKILYEWNKAGIKTVEDVEKRRKTRKDKKNDDTNIDLEIVDWNWFDEDE